MKVPFDYTGDSQLNVTELLTQDRSVTIHHHKKKQKNCNLLRQKYLKPNNTFPELLNEQKKVKNVYFGSESLSSQAPKIWELVPDSIKSEKSLSPSRQLYVQS